MPDRPLTVHCSGLGGGLLSPDHEYDLFFKNHAQMKVYGLSLAMTDDWGQHITQLGLTKTTHEYAIYQLLSTAVGWGAWKEFLPGQICEPQAFDHPCYTAVDGCYHPAGTCETSPPHVGHSGTSNLSMLPSTGQTAAGAGRVFPIL